MIYEGKNEEMIITIKFINLYSLTKTFSCKREKFATKTMKLKKIKSVENMIKNLEKLKASFTILIDQCS